MNKAIICSISFALDEVNTFNPSKDFAIFTREAKSLSEITLNLIRALNEGLIKSNSANCFLTGLIIHYENFKSQETNPQVFRICSELIEKGADHRQVINNIYKTTEKEVNFLGQILQNLKVTDNGMSVAVLDSIESQNFAESEASTAIEKIKAIGIQSDLLVLWQSHASESAVKGFFYSKKTGLINKVAQIEQQSLVKNDWLFLSMSGSDINLVKDKIIKIINQ